MSTGRMLEENSQLRKNKGQQRWYEALKEQKETREILQTYAPWGRPGCGAPDPEARERRRQQLQDLRLQGTRRLGNGESPGSSKNGEVICTRGGCGAPIRTRSGRIVATRHPDPLLFFQPQAALRRCVEERLRYRSSTESKLAYKNDLDELVRQRKKAEAEERYRALKVDRLLGWTNPGDERRAQERKISPKEQRKPNDSGVELVPLLIQKRVLNKRHSRCNTDVTSGRAVWETAAVDKKAKELQYLQELNQQVAFKQQKMQEVRKEELASCLRHAERWQQIWSSEPRRPLLERATRCRGTGLLPKIRHGMGEAVALG